MAISPDFDAPMDLKSHGIDFDKLADNRAALGLDQDGPAWARKLDDPKLSRKVLGLKRTKSRARK